MVLDLILCLGVCITNKKTKRNAPPNPAPCALQRAHLPLPRRFKRLFVPRDARVVEVNLGQLRQRLQMGNVPRDAYVAEVNPGQVMKTSK